MQRHVLATSISAVPIRFGPWLSGILAVVALVLGAQSFRQPLATVWPVSEFTYSKDFAQDYLIARAVAAHGQLYVPLRQLAVTYVGLESGDPHEALVATPHPPTLGVLLLPLAQLDYPIAATIWLAFEVLLVALVAYLAAGPRIEASLALFGVLLAWHAVRHELVLGQVMLLMLALVVGARRAWQTDRTLLAGVLLGATLLVKPLLWPLLAVLALRRDWRMLAGAVGLAAVGWLGTGLLVGFDQLHTYAFDVLPVTSQVGDGLRNLSAWTLAGRLGVPVAAPVVPCVLLIALLFATRRASGRDAALSLAIPVSVLVTPVAWDHYLVLAVVPLAFALAQLRWLDWPRRETNMASLCVVLLAAPTPEAAALLFGIGSRAAGVVESLWLMAAVASLAVLVARVLVKANR